MATDLTRRRGRSTHLRAAGRKAIGTGLGCMMIAFGRRSRALRQLDRGRYVICAVGHKPTRRLMRETIEWLETRRFTFVSQTDVLEAIVGRRELPRRAVWLVFDDGWKEYQENVLPLLRQRSIPSTLAISPGETRREVAWPDLVRTHGGSDLRVKDLMKMPERERQEVVSTLWARVGSYARRQLLPVKDIQGLARDPLITIENHTNSHVCAPRCSTDEFRHEVTTASDSIEAWTGRRPTLLCYPFGLWRAELDGLLSTCGVASSANSGNRLLDLDTHRSTMAIPRIAILDDVSLAETTCRLLRVWVK